MNIVTRLRAAGCVFAEDEARLLVAAARDPADLAAMVERRVAGDPLEVIVGWAEFRGLRVRIAPGVFVPRRRTEFLVEQAALRTRPGAVVVDLCCGSGALGLALAAAVGRVELHAADVEPAAVACARTNLGGQVYAGDLYEALPAALRGRVDIVICNAPYVPTGVVATLPPEARLHEPRVALDGGGDGLAILRRVVAGAPGWLAVGGHLLVEAGLDQAPVLAADVERAGLVASVVRSEEWESAVIIASRIDVGLGGRGSAT